MARSPINKHGVGGRVGERRADGQRQRSGSRPKRSFSRIRTSATLVREPSSKANVEILAARTRLNSFTLSTGPRQAMQASETIR